MLFNSLDFAFFLPIVFLLYWFVVNKNLQLQNWLIVVVSYVFYGWWDWRFLFLIFLSTAIDYWVGIGLLKENDPSKRKYLLWLSLVVNLGLLAYFKYANFFLDSFTQAFSFFGTSINANSLNIILPVGISFYTLQTLSYTIDVYKGKIQPTRNFVAFAGFVSFFPQLVAGPIERAKHLLPQFEKKRTFEYKKAADGLRQILWGLVKKVVIADNCAVFVNDIFANVDVYPGSTLFLGLIFFSIQVYGDFSGYSDIAIGTARLFGFSLNQNFAYPFFSRSMRELWKRWHISLYSWFKDYVYIPLNQFIYGKKKNKLIGIMIVFLLSGLWHGASWTFIIWGGLNGVLLVLSVMVSKKKVYYTGTVAEGKLFPDFNESFGMLSTFLLFSLTLIFFRANDLSHALEYCSKMFSASLFQVPVMLARFRAFIVFLIILVFMSLEWSGRQNHYAIQKVMTNKPRIFRWVFYCLLVVTISIFTRDVDVPFIYFQF